MLNFFKLARIHGGAGRQTGRRFLSASVRSSLQQLGPFRAGCPSPSVSRARLCPVGLGSVGWGLVCFGLVCLGLGPFDVRPVTAQDELSSQQLEAVLAAERARVEVIQQVYGSVVAVYGDDQNGGGSGVIFDPSGLALTNHHVIMGAGVSGFGGLADGKLYPWKLVGTDPGGDVAIIKLEGEAPFPYSVLADSDEVRVGDWSLAMGNPFILAEDQTPTVTLGIVSGVKRYQYGQGNELVYGNCIQTDSSINPGNSGGPLFNLAGQVIGINGRGSFEERGRVNVGLGYAISSNQIKNFIPDLLATKLVEHGTLDARFGNRTDGVICETLNRDAPIAKLGLDLGDRLVAFEGQPIDNANEFTNLICTLPEDWPAEVTFQKEGGEFRTVHVRLLGLPYSPPPQRRQATPDQPPEDNEDNPDSDGDQEDEDKPEGGDTDEDEDEGQKRPEPTPAQKKQMEKQRAMQELLASTPGTIRDESLNQENLTRLVTRWRANTWLPPASATAAWQISDEIRVGGEVVGNQTIVLDNQGRFRLEVDDRGLQRTYVYDGETVAMGLAGELKAMRSTDAAADRYLNQVLPIASLVRDQPLALFGQMWLDGGGKAQSKPAYRLKCLDELGNWFYCWLSIPEGADRSDVQLLKAALDKDSEEGGVTFGDWNLNAGLRWPHRREFVQGLAENVEAIIQTKELKPIATPSSELFQVSDVNATPGSTEPPKNVSQE